MIKGLNHTSVVLFFVRCQQVDVMNDILTFTGTFWLLACFGVSSQNLRELTGYSLTYETRSQVLSGIPQSADQYSGLSLIHLLKADVLSKNKVVFTIQDVHLGKLNEEVPGSYAEDIKFQHFPSPHYERELSKPFIAYFDGHKVQSDCFVNPHVLASPTCWLVLGCLDDEYDDVHSSLVFSWVFGSVDKFETQKNDPIWSVNLKKSILEKFQVDLKKQGVPVGPALSNYVPRIDPSSTTYSTYEKGVGGECETRYSLFSVPSMDHPDPSTDVLNVTKVKNYQNCRTRPIFAFDNIETQGSPTACELKNSPVPEQQPGVWRDSSSVYESGCHFGFEPDQHPVKSYSIVKYNISSSTHSPVIESIWAESKTAYNLNGRTMLVVAQQNITLVKKRPLASSVLSISNPVACQSLEYEFPVGDYMDMKDSFIFNLYGRVNIPDLIQVTIRQLESLASSIVSSQISKSKDSGTKVIQLVNAFTLFKRKELDTVFQQFEYLKTERPSRKQEITRKLVLDILAIAASDEASLYARDLIRENRVEIWEAAELLEGIGKNADEPSAEVINAYFKLLDLPLVQESRRLFPAVAISLSKMIQDSCVDLDKQPLPQKTKQQRMKFKVPFAEKKSGSSEETSQGDVNNQEAEECTSEQLQEYIRILLEKLQNAKSLNEVVVYVEALAHLSTPEVLPHLKTYVNGHAPMPQALDDEDISYLRVISMYALHHLTPESPDEILEVVTPVYFNVSEDYDIRAAAFSVLIACDPPLTLLESITTTLHNENNNQIRSYVYSLLSERANSTLPADRKMAQKIQLILSYAPDSHMGWQYSNSFHYTTYDEDSDYGLAAAVEYISSNVSSYPRAFYGAVDTIFDPFQDSMLQMGGTFKGVEELLQKIQENGKLLSDIFSTLRSNTQARNIPEVIDILKNKLLLTNQGTDIPRAVLYYKLFGRTTYLSLDEQYVMKILEQAVSYFRQMDLTSGLSTSYVKVWMPSSFFRVVPSTVGLPVVVNHRNPVILSLNLDNARVSVDQQEDSSYPPAVAVSTTLQASLHTSSIALAYVIDHVHDELHGVSVEKTSEAALATELEAVINMQKETYVLSVNPQLPNQLFYHSTRPCTFVAPADIITEPKQEWLDQVNEIETVPQAFKFQKQYEAYALGLNLRTEGESENPWSDIPIPLTNTANEDGIFASLLEVAINPEMINRELHIHLEPHPRHPSKQIVITANFDKHIMFGSPKSTRNNQRATSSEEDQPREEEEEKHYEKAVSTIYGRSFVDPDAQTTIANLVQRTETTWTPAVGQGYSGPVPAIVTHVLELTLSASGEHEKQYAYRAVYAHSLEFRFNWFDLVGHHFNELKEKPFQFCSSLLAVFPEIPSPFYMQESLENKRVILEGEVGWGTDCSQQTKISLSGIVEKSEKQLASRDANQSESRQPKLPWYYSQCQADVANGETQSNACQKVISEDSQLNVIKLDIIAPHLSDEIMNVTENIELFTKYSFYPNLDVDPLANNEDGRVSIWFRHSKQVPDVPVIDVEVRKPRETFVLSRLYIPFFEPTSTLGAFDEVFLDQFYGDNYVPECNLMEDRLRTFDNVTVELSDNKCQYLLAQDLSSEKKFTIIASQIDLREKTKALLLVLAGHSLNAFPPSADAVPIILDGKSHQVLPSKPLVLDFDKETELRVYVRPAISSQVGPILVVEAPDDDITVEYGGKNVRIKLPRDYQGDQVGLCGDFNDEQFQEFTGPSGCIYVEEEDFVNSYIIPGQNCPKMADPRGPVFCSEERGEQRPMEGVSQGIDERPDSKRPEERRVSPRVKNPAHHHRWSSEEQKQTKKDSTTNKTESEEESSENIKPSGPSRCIQQYTPTYMDKQNKSTCFATKPSYKCRPGCRAITTMTERLPFHCLPESKYEKVLKDLARNGLVQQMQNKKVEAFKEIEVPEKCM